MLQAYLFGEIDMYGYVLERCGVTWSERFWFDIPSVNSRGFGSDERARIFLSREEAATTSKYLNDKLGVHTTVVKRSDLYPPTWSI